jgi:hypothetical protein
MHEVQIDIATEARRGFCNCGLARPWTGIMVSAGPRFRNNEHVAPVDSTQLYSAHHLTLVAVGSCGVHETAAGSQRECYVVDTILHGAAIVAVIEVAVLRAKSDHRHQNVFLK